jgi:hypothetical protein
MSRVLLDERSDQAQQFLVLGTSATAQEGPDLDVIHIPS